MVHVRRSLADDNALTVLSARRQDRFHGIHTTNTDT